MVPRVEYREVAYHTEEHVQEYQEDLAVPELLEEVIELLRAATRILLADPFKQHIQDVEGPMQTDVPDQSASQLQEQRHLREIQCPEYQSAHVCSDIRPAQV